MEIISPNLVRPEGYFIEHNGEFWQSVFPSYESQKSQLHSDVDDAFYYMNTECGVPAAAIIVCPVKSLMK